MRGLLLDLDGVLYTGDEAIPGAAQTIRWLTDQQIPFKFLTNTTSRPRQAIVDKLANLEIIVTADQIITPAVAAHEWLRRHEITNPALFVPPATAEELADLQPADAQPGAVVVGDLGEGWDFATLNRAFQLLVANPQIPLIALGMTRYWRAEDGLRLDVGAFVRALEYASGRHALVLGKPDPAFFLTAVRELDLDPRDVVMIGDDIRSDVEGAQKAGLTGVLVCTGKFSPSDLADSVPDAVLNSIADLPQWWSSAH